MENKFEGFPKMPRFSRDVVITEKIDGTNGQVFLFTEEEAIMFGVDWVEKYSTRVTDELFMAVGSRKRYILPNDDNYGFARWCWDHHKELAELGPGRHFGEWWGQGIQRSYGLKEKRFSLFNTGRWNEQTLPQCCHVVPTLYTGKFETSWINSTLALLEATGSIAAPGFMNPEGIIIFHTAGQFGFKKTIKDDGIPKSLAKAA